MVIDNFDLVGSVLFPNETDSPFLVDSYAVLAFSVSAQSFKTICGRDAQVAQFFRDVELQEFPVGDLLYDCGQFARKMTFAHLAGLLTPKALDHTS